MYALITFVTLLGLLNVFNALPLPVAPDNIVCFPERDFCTVESFLAYSGQSLTLRVNRAGILVGGAVGTVSGTDVAFEVNHPGGLCWGASYPGLQVTPDLKAGDVVSVSLGSIVLADMIIQDGLITSVEWDGNRVIRVNGKVAGLDPANTEIRVVNPDFTNTAVGRRDVRAIPGNPVTNAGYTSQVVFTGTSFVATFTFDAVELATICNSGAFSLSMWQFTDAVGNAQGLTISEFGETGGPFSNSCPPSATVADPILPSEIVVAGNTIKWNPATNLPGVDVFTAYQVEVMKPGTTPTQVYAYRVASTETQVNVASTTLVSNDVINIRTITGPTRTSDSYTKTFALISTATTITTSPPPAIGGATSANSISFVTSASSVQIVYTVSATSGVEPFVGGVPTADSIVYKRGSSIPITGNVYIKAVAFSTAGTILASTDFINFTPIVVIPPTAVSAAPTVKIGTGSITTNWVAPSDPTIVGYEVQVFSGVTKVLTIDANTPTYIFTTGTTGTKYKFAVRSYNIDGTYSALSPFSPEAIFPTLPDAISITSARVIVGKEFRAQGTGNVDGAIVTAYTATATGALGRNLGYSATVGACVAGVCTYDIRVRSGNVAGGYTAIYVVSNKGGRAGPFIL